jgi:hypothetical protein
MAVNVLAVMRELGNVAYQNAGGDSRDPSVVAVTEARAAVAELIRVVQGAENALRLYQLSSPEFIRTDSAQWADRISVALACFFGGTP